MTNLEHTLIRTDSTTMGYIPYKKQVGSVLSTWSYSTNKD